MRVLIVDDVTDVADSTSWLMQEVEGSWQVRAAYGAGEGYEAALAFRPDAVVIDLTMPGMNGFELARRLRGAFGAALVLVAFTGRARSQDREAALAGFDQVVLKPAEIGELVDVIKRHAATRGIAGG